MCIRDRAYPLEGVPPLEKTRAKEARQIILDELARARGKKR